jgi:hypothetical protein
MFDDMINVQRVADALKRLALAGNHARGGGSSAQRAALNAIADFEAGVWIPAAFEAAAAVIAPARFVRGKAGALAYEPCETDVDVLAAIVRVLTEYQRLTG